MPGTGLSTLLILKTLYVVVTHLPSLQMLALNLKETSQLALEPQQVLGEWQGFELRSF